MVSKTLVAEVYMWETLIGYVSWDEEFEYGSFEYEPKFLHAPIEPAPLKMPKNTKVYNFRDLNRETFKGLPGMLADSLPDKFGNALIDAWLAQQGRKAETFNPIERLCYIGSRGMGTLEFKPAKYRGRLKDVNIEIEEMVKLASEILTKRKDINEKLNFDNKEMKEALTNLLAVGTSAGGARAKCIIAYNEGTGEVRSGQVRASKDFGYWLLKLDGVENNTDKELSDPKGYGRIEYAYHLMAKECEIDMTECRLLEESGRSHFMTKRFDRLEGGEKIHMQSLCAMAHFDFNMPGAYSYEQSLDVIRQVVASSNVTHALEQQFRRAVFNIVGRNQDDHAKNTTFLMDKKGIWSLSPAYDVIYSYNPTGEWTSRHQMSVNGKRDDFEIDDLITLAEKADIKMSKAKDIITQIKDVFSVWEKYAEEADVLKTQQEMIRKNLRVNL